MTRYLFTSEAVSEGHPDKIADQISDHILDAILIQDPHARVACECLVKTGLVLVAGEIATQAWVDVESIVRRVITQIGYSEDNRFGFSGQSCAVLNAIGTQSSDIAQGIHDQDETKQGAGDQGLMFGYACEETPVLMPAPIYYAQALMQRHAHCRHQGALPFLGPDAKAQIGILYEDHQPVAIDHVVLSTQHTEDIALDVVRDVVMDEIIRPVLPADWCHKDTRFLINPAGRFVIGGPVGDCGLTGRKIIVDTYGGMARHGGGAFSGKDPSKVDRSGAYMARFLAKHVVASGLASRCEIQLAYAIGVAKPTAIRVDTFGTGVLADELLASRIADTFSCTPYDMIQQLDLLTPRYAQTSCYGHFGREDDAFTWEHMTEKATFTSWLTDK